MKNAIEIKHLSKRFTTFALQDLNLTIPAGAICGLVGENGAGKSTTLRLLMNALARDEGEVAVLGVDNRAAEFSALKNDIGVVLDEAYFPEVLNALQVNRVMKETYSRWDEGKYFGYLKAFGLPEKQKFKDFSRGMKMKLAIAVTLSHDPKLLLLDEATSGLDPMVRDEILDIFADFTREEDHSILLSSHIVSDLEKICDYIAFLHRGRLVLFEEKDRLLEEYGVVQCSAKQLEDLPEGAVLGKAENCYGARVLVKRGTVSSAFAVERTTLEDIILLLVKGEKK